MFAGVSYGRFIAERLGFNVSAYIQNRWWKVGGEIFKRRNGWELLTDASSLVRIQSRTSVVWVGVQRSDCVSFLEMIKLFYWI